ncbi:hypothetical protein LSH36_678g02083 [Paralvinella palmiformis]|uniref:RING-type domain-containing protein n=1 Tax=Paralvinella palmiformis TaxID=53620 RepID=A0AAD9J3S6_9ANNE|nr:hypothetical protein LSH36_678g02083 [Paralvinella palmiformis]
MATGGFYEELFSDITNCEICFEPLEQRRPRTLSCLHVFCEDCLQHLLDDAKAKSPQTPDSIRCPVCSQTTQVPGGSSASLPLSFYLSKVQNVDNWLEPVMGIPESRIEDTAKLITDVKKQLPSFDINIKPETIKFIIGDDQIKLGEIVKEAIKSPVVSMSSRLCEDLLTKAIQSLDTISVIDDPTLLCQIKTGGYISDIEYLDNGQLVVCTWDGLKIYDDNGDEIDHYLSRNCKRVGGVGGLWGMSVGRNVGNFVVTD